MGPTEKKFYVLEGTYNAWAWFMGPIYPLFLLSRGLDLLQASSVLATYFVVTFIFEIPTGAVADVFGRRISFILACCTRMVAFGLYYFADGYLDCLVAEAVDAIGTTLASGALQAWAVDGIREDGTEGPIDRVFARAQAVGRMQMILGGVVGGMIADVDIALPWLVAAAGFGGTGVYAFVAMHEKRRSGVVSWRLAHRSIADTIASAFQLARNTAVVRLLCLITIATASGIMPVHFMWPARLESLLDSHTFLLFGWIWALVNLTAVAGSALSARLHRSFAREAVLFASCIGRAAGIIVAALGNDFAVVLGGLLFMELAFAVSHPAYQAWLNEHIEADLRATVLSVANMSFTIGGAMGLLTIGWVARSSGIPIAWTMCAFVLVAVAPGFLVIGRIARPPER